MMLSHGERRKGHKLIDSCFQKILKTYVTNVLSNKENNSLLSKRIFYWDDVIIW